MPTSEQAYFGAFRFMMRSILLAVIRAYKLFLSPWLGSSCRFEPTCSTFAQQALELHGASSGAYLAVGRIFRCHPGCAGGVDPVPVEKPLLFSRLIPSSKKNPS